MIHASGTNTLEDYKNETICPKQPGFRNNQLLIVLWLYKIYQIKEYSTLEK